MSSQINLDDSAPNGLDSLTAVSPPEPPPVHRRQLATPDWDRTSPGQLKLYVPNEPLIGDEFSYNGVRWQVVDYRDGWIARILL